jgi:hypothetical protein
MDSRPASLEWKKSMPTWSIMWGLWFRDFMLHMLFWHAVSTLLVIACRLPSCCNIYMCMLQGDFSCCKHIPLLMSTLLRVSRHLCVTVLDTFSWIFLHSFGKFECQE